MAKSNPAIPGTGGRPTGSSPLPQDPTTPSRPDRYRELFERSADAILIIDGDTFIDCNEATVRMLRYRDKAELLQSHPSEASPEFQPDLREHALEIGRGKSG